MAAIAKKTLRNAGCAIEYVAEMTPDDTPEGKLIENFFDSLAEFYSAQLSVNTTRGMRYNAQNARSNGHRVLGYRKSKDSRYEIDPETAPIVQRIFADYAGGKRMQEIADDLAAQGVRSIRGNKLSINSLRHILRNDRHLGIYRYDDVVVPDGMPQLIDQETFDKVQERLEQNKRKGPQLARGRRTRRASAPTSRSSRTPTSATRPCATWSSIASSTRSTCTTAGASWSQGGTRTSTTRSMASA